MPSDKISRFAGFSCFQLWMLCELKIQFERHMNEGKYHLAEPLITAICALNKTEGLFRKALVLKALNRTSEAYSVLQWLQGHCETTAKVELVIRCGHVISLLLNGFTCLFVHREILKAGDKYL